MDDGESVFFYPTRFATFGLQPDFWENVDPKYSLLADDNWPYPNQFEQLTFPLPNPLGGLLHRRLAGLPHHMLQRKPTIKINTIHRLPLSTTNDSLTKTAPKVQELDLENQLHQVRRCPVFWDNLMSYASEFGQLNTFGDHAPPIAFGQDQALAICSLHGWYQKSLNQKIHLVNSEPAVQDVIRTQLLDFADIILQTRYRPTVINDVGLLGRPPVGSYMPMWGRAVAENHSVPDHGKSRAGYPDFIMFYSPEYLHHAAVTEVKNPWSYKREMLRGIFQNLLLTNTPENVAQPPPGVGGGFVMWDNSQASATLIKQIWGQLQFFRANWGMWTNGEEIIVYVVTQRFNPQIPGTCNQLTFSDPISINTEDVVHHGFAGFCFASLDSNADYNPNAPVGNPYFLVDILCPPEMRLNPLNNPLN